MIIDNSRFETRLNCPKFGAVPRAMYRPAKDSYVKIYELEKNDLPFVTNFLGNLKQFFKKKNINDASKKEIIENAFDSAKKSLALDAPGKAKFLVGMENGELCGIVAGNIPKVDKNGVIHYSSRKNHSKKETEMDWLTAWGAKGTGKSLVTEYLRSTRKDGFKEVFIRSEVPEVTYAQAFYEKLGFTKLPSEREKIAKNNTNKYVIGEYYSGDEEIIPMIAKKHSINETINRVSSQFKRQELVNTSVNLENIIK